MGRGLVRQNWYEFFTITCRLLLTFALNNSEGQRFEISGSFFVLTRAADIIRKNTVLLGHIIPCSGNQTNIIGNGTKKIMESQPLKDSQRA